MNSLADAMVSTGVCALKRLYFIYARERASAQWRLLMACMTNQISQRALSLARHNKTNLNKI
jgi:hypothetical protein